MHIISFSRSKHTLPQSSRKVYFLQHNSIRCIVSKGSGSVVPAPAIRGNRCESGVGPLLYVRESFYLGNGVFYGVIRSLETGRRKTDAERSRSQRANQETDGAYNTLAARECGKSICDAKKRSHWYALYQCGRYCF